MRSLIILSLTFYSLCTGATLKYNMRDGKPGYEILDIRGVKVWKAPELANLTPERKKNMINFIKRILFETEKYTPNTLKEFKRKEYKIMLFQERTPSNGLEFLRDNQHQWDERIDKRGTMDRSIIFIKTMDYVAIGSRRALFYFVHELAHFRHLALSRDLDSEIDAAYKSAKAEGKYFNAYAGKNRLEYFADISASFLLPENRAPKFPRGALELKKYDPKGYELCATLWSSEPMPPPALQGLNFGPGYAYKPPKPANPILIRRANPIKSGRYTTAYDNSSAVMKEYRFIYNEIEDAKMYIYLKRPSQARAHLTKANEMLSSFMLKYPNWKNNMAEKTMTELQKEAIAFRNLSLNK